MQVQSCCNSFAYSTNCFFDVLVVVAVVASYTQSLVSCSVLFKAFLNLTECKQRIWFPESSGIRNPGLQNPEYSSKTRNRTTSHLESRIQVPLTKTGIRSPRRGIQNPGLSWIPLHGAINLIKKKRRTITIKEHKIGKPNEKGNICELN